MFSPLLRVCVSMARIKITLTIMKCVFFWLNKVNSASACAQFISQGNIYYFCQQQGDDEVLLIWIALLYNRLRFTLWNWTNQSFRVVELENVIVDNVPESRTCACPTQPLLPHWESHSILGVNDFGEMSRESEKEWENGKSAASYSGLLLLPKKMCLYACNNFFCGHDEMSTRNENELLQKINVSSVWSYNDLKRSILILTRKVCPKQTVHDED